MHCLRNHICRPVNCRNRCSSCNPRHGYRESYRMQRACFRSKARWSCCRRR
ncbi:MAG: hypothetical protein K5643_01540 [Saccharofermentans sp.]|nr:hypothetical protein [Saccharofermentans sp.]